MDEADRGRAVLLAAGGSLERKHRDALLGGERVEAHRPARALDEGRAGPQQGAQPDGERGHDPAAPQAEPAPRARHLVRARRHRAAGLHEVLAELAQVAGEVERRGVALGRVLGEAAALDQPPHGRGHVRVEAGDRLGRVLDDRGEGLGARLPPERRSSGRELVQDRAERELVATVVDGATAGLLRRHVAHGAEHDAGRGLRGGRVGPGRRGRVEPLLSLARRVRAQLGEAEVEQLHEAVVRHHHVLGLEVAVDDAGGVRLREPVRHLRADLEDAPHGQRAAVEHHLAQRVALHQLHHDVRHSRGLADVVDRDDVRVVERGRRARLLREAAEPQRVGGEPLRQELDRHVAVQLLVVRPPDLAHSSRADAGGQLVSAEPHPGSGRHLARLRVSWGRRRQTTPPSWTGQGGHALRIPCAGRHGARATLRRRALRSSRGAARGSRGASA